MSWYAKQDRCGDGPGHNALVLLAGANKGQSTSNVLSACPRARMHIFEIVPKLFEQQQKRFKDSPWVTVHRRGWSDTRLLLEGLTCKFTYDSGITTMQRITCCLYFGSLSQAMKCYKLHKIQPVQSLCVHPTRTQDKVQTFHITAPAEGLSLQAAVAQTVRQICSLKS